MSEDILGNVEERLHRAVDTLNKLRMTTSDPIEAERLQHKTEGVRLALSYIYDEKRIFDTLERL